MPPEGVPVNDAMLPTHNPVGGNVKIGVGYTVPVVVEAQPVVKPVNVTAKIPTAQPETAPELDPTVATRGLLLDQIPVAGIAVNVVVEPAHNEPDQLLMIGRACTVTVVVE